MIDFSIEDTENVVKELHLRKASDSNELADELCFICSSANV